MNLSLAFRLQSIEYKFQISIKIHTKSKLARQTNTSLSAKGRSSSRDRGLIRGQSG